MTNATEIDKLVPLPTDKETLDKCLRDPIWRITSGCHYKITAKGDDGRKGLVQRFKLNQAPRPFTGHAVLS